MIEIILMAIGCLVVAGLLLYFWAVILGVIYGIIHAIKDGKQTSFWTNIYFLGAIGFAFLGTSGTEWIVNQLIQFSKTI